MISDPLAGWQQHSPRVRALRLLRWAAAGVAVVSPLVVTTRGTAGLVALVVAAGVCTGGALVAQGVAAAAALDVFGRLAVGLVIRMMFPSLACVLVASATPHGVLAEGGFYALTIGFYLYTLAVDCFLALPRRADSSPANE
ncbi:MAG: hypothetical protein WDZ59_13500 [Pirellulales bacterium]